MARIVGTVAQPTDVEIAGTDLLRQFLAIRGLGWVKFDSTVMDLSVALDELPTYLASIVGPSHSVGVRTGTSAADVVIKLTESGDAAGLVAAAVNQLLECSTTPMSGRPFCEDGVEDGTLVSVFRAAGCHGEYYESAVTPVGWLFEESGQPRDQGRVYAVRGPLDGDTRGRYAIVFGSARAVWVDDAGAITHIQRGCGPGTLPLGGLEPFLLGPPIPAGVDIRG